MKAILEMQKAVFWHKVGTLIVQSLHADCTNLLSACSLYIPHTSASKIATENHHFCEASIASPKKVFLSLG